MCDGNGIPLALHLTDGQRHDVTQAQQTLEQIRVPRRSGRPRTRPGGLAADKGYDSREFRTYLRKRGIRHSIPRRRDAGKRRVGRPPAYHEDLSERRWVVERLFRKYEGYRRLMLRHERHAFIHLGLLHIASIIITLRVF